jgi:hypothetical protein
VQTGRVKAEATQLGETAPQPSGKKQGKKTGQDGNGETSAGGVSGEGQK